MCRDEEFFKKRNLNKGEEGCFSKKRKNFGGENQTYHFLCSFLSAYNPPPPPGGPFICHHIKKRDKTPLDILVGIEKEKIWCFRFSNKIQISTSPTSPTNIENQSFPPKSSAILPNIPLSLPSVHCHVPFFKNPRRYTYPTPAIILAFSKR